MRVSAAVSSQHSACGMLLMLHCMAASSASNPIRPRACRTCPAGSKAADKRRKDGPAAARPVPAAAPRWYVTAAELASVPSYIKGRLTLEKVGCCCVSVYPVHCLCFCDLPAALRLPGGPLLLPCVDCSTARPDFSATIGWRAYLPQQLLAVVQLYTGTSRRAAMYWPAPICMHIMQPCCPAAQHPSYTPHLSTPPPAATAAAAAQLCRACWLCFDQMRLANRSSSYTLYA